MGEDREEGEVAGKGRDEGRGIQERRPLFPGGGSIAERVVQKYAEMSFPA
jgi:hypothetical protein